MLMDYDRGQRGYRSRNGPRRQCGTIESRCRDRRDVNDRSTCFIIMPLFYFLYIIYFIYIAVAVGELKMLVSGFFVIKYIHLYT